ncbi:MAG: GNAT family N-acetyltransferase [Bacilli bacterium]|nr:GNAT family N-acetyltransferase [Bacilli bacterium]
MRCVQFTNEKKYIEDFLSLPKKLYTKKNNTEDSKTILSVLEGRHSLSKSFTLSKFLIYKNDEVVGRFIITEYSKEKKKCYLGFFECVRDRKVAKFLFQNAESFAKEKKYKKIVGPVDASFWIKYRLKINHFDRPYTGEPYNLDYYYSFFLENHYKVSEHYTSQIYEPLDDNYSNEGFSRHYEDFTKRGYEIIQPDGKDFEKCMGEVYDLITVLYSDFPVFQNIKKERFLKIYQSYKSIINMSMVRMAYYEGKAVGFYISIPNYYNLVYHLNIINLFKIMRIKKHPKGYVMLYMGVDQKHRGLGKAMIYSIVQELKKQKVPSIGALTHDGKISQNYASEVIESRYEYVLLEKSI